MNGSLLEFKVTSVEKPNQWLRYRGRIEVNQQGQFYIAAKYLEYRVADNNNIQIQDYMKWWGNNWQCESVQIDKNQLIIELRGATINANRVEAP